MSKPDDRTLYVNGTNADDLTELLKTDLGEAFEVKSHGPERISVSTPCTQIDGRDIIVLLIKIEGGWQIIGPGPLGPVYNDNKIHPSDTDPVLINASCVMSDSGNDVLAADNTASPADAVMKVTGAVSALDAIAHRYSKPIWKLQEAAEVLSDITTADLKDMASMTDTELRPKEFFHQERLHDRKCSIDICTPETDFGSSICSACHHTVGTQRASNRAILWWIHKIRDGADISNLSDTDHTVLYQSLAAGSIAYGYSIESDSRELRNSEIITASLARDTADLLASAFCLVNN